MDKITLKSPKSITIIIEFYYNDFGALAYHIHSQNNRAEGRCLKKAEKEAEETFLLVCSLSESPGIFKICLKNSATVVPPPAF